LNVNILKFAFCVLPIPRRANAMPIFLALGPSTAATATVAVGVGGDLTRQFTRQLVKKNLSLQ
jgi:hypothetical protein